MSAMASQITSLAICHSTVYSGANKKSHWSLCGEFAGTGEFPVQRASNASMFPFDNVIMMVSWDLTPYLQYITSNMQDINVFLVLSSLCGDFPMVSCELIILTWHGCCVSIGAIICLPQYRWNGSKNINNIAKHSLRRRMQTSNVSAYPPSHTKEDAFYIVL